MRAVLLDGERRARDIRARLAADVVRLRARGVLPCLATVLVGGDPASAEYIGRKHEDCRALGIAGRDLRLPAETVPAALEAQIDRLNADRAIHGVLVQLPLPAHLEAEHFTARVDPAKDIDGLHPANIGRLVQGRAGVLPCTPAAVLDLLRAHAVPIAGREVVIIGRGRLVGAPLAWLMAGAGVDATVTIAHHRSRDLARITARADILVSATGVAGLVTAAMVRPGAAVVGVGIARDGAGDIVSDIADDVAAVAGWVTPRHGSVGAMTRAMLLANLLALADADHGAGAAGGA